MLWNPKGGLLHQSNLGSVPSAMGTNFTTGAAASTKGAIAEMFASTAFDAFMLSLYIPKMGISGVASETAVDILIGAATEEVLIANLLCGYSLGRMFQFPLYIPSGSRLSLRGASARTSTTFNSYCHLHGGHGSPPFRVGSKITTYGIGTVPNGTTITPGASDAAGAWVQITASTSEDHFALLPGFQVAADTTINQLRYLVDVGIGAAATETVMASYVFTTTAEEYMLGPSNPFPFYRDIPSGSRLTMRASNSGANDGAYNGAIYALS